MTIAFSEDRKVTSTEDVLQAVKETAPLSKTAPEKITKMRQWAKQTGVPKANKGEVAKVTPKNSDAVIRTITGFDTDNGEKKEEKK